MEVAKKFEGYMPVEQLEVIRELIAYADAEFTESVTARKPGEEAVPGIVSGLNTR